MTREEFLTLSATLPTEPGIYKYHDEQNTLLYIGKARNIRKRVSSYFSGKAVNFKTRELVRRIHHIEFTIVNNEQDAFLLENSLIKQFKPRFNIDLKDDKTYPYIVIKNEPFSRVFFTRRKIADGSQYLGPFTSVAKVRELLEFIKGQIPLRNCTLNLSDNNIARKKFKVCLEFHLGNCKGPCEGLQSRADYDSGLMRLREILKGDLNGIIRHYRERIAEKVKEMAFEEAEIIKQKLKHLQEYQSSSTVVSEKTGTVDVFSILEENDTAYVNYLSVNDGAVIFTKTIILQKKLEEEAAEVLSFAIGQIRSTYDSTAKEFIVPLPISYPDSSIRITVPRGGVKKKLLDLSRKNVNHFAGELRQKKMLHLEDKSGAETMSVLLQLKKDLQLQEVPLHIECFDNSNFQGSFPVSAMVCFRNGLPSKSDYRKFNVKTVKGPDDFATMSEVVHRRYHRLMREEQPLPQLVIIDGGKGQLNAAMESIRELGLTGKMTFIGLAKNEEELFFYGDRESVKLPWNSESLKLIRRIRDEVHRFGIGFHRNQRSRGALRNTLEDIPGIGKQTAELLLKKFRSVANVHQATETELEAVVGKAKAGIIIRHRSLQAEDKK